LRQNVAPGCDTLSRHSNPLGSNLCVSLTAVVEIRVLPMIEEEIMRRESKVREDLVDVELPAGPVYSFLPAHGGSRAGAVAEQLSRALSEVPGFSVLLAGFAAREYSLWNPADSPRRLDGHTWGAFVFDSRGLEVLDAREVYPRQLRRVLEYAQRKYRIVCADVTEAKEAHSLETLRTSECIFIVSHSDRASLEMAREKRLWLKSIDLADQCGLLLDRVPGGVTADEAEEISGLPMCSMVDRPEFIERLAGWLVAEENFSSEPAYAVVN
jgi:hypothetical protein